ncbi:uncharacterized protein V1510DRAFT_347661, partial [Dipodascopsis tothii]|uniref:uncharacterized protein n=1 Tax=Dipodascopsis tothii TaxID=44089 RepID=UPI0034CEE8E5
SEAGGSDDDEFVNPYPLEGKYKDRADQQWMETLAEIEREEILFERSQEMQRFNERKYLAQRLRENAAQRARGDKTRTSARDKTGTKRSTLSELKKKREEKSVRDRARSGEHTYAGTKLVYDEDSDSARSASPEPPWKAAPALGAADVNRVRFGRTLFAKFCHYPEFGELAVDCFVRINIGFNRERQQDVYRVCQIKAITPSKAYTFMNRTVAASVLVTHGASERTFEMGICSDGAVTDDEYAQWREAMERDHLALPSVAAVDRKFAALQQMRERSLTADEINNMIDVRQKLTAHRPAHSVVRKTQLNQQRIIALGRGDDADVAALDAQIAAIDERSTALASDTPLDRLAKVNSRNRRANQDEIRKAEIRANESRRRAMMAQTSDVTSDPFSRLRTNIKMYYDTSAAAPATAAETKAEDDAAAPAPAETVARPLGALDDVISAIDFAVDID